MLEKITNETPEMSEYADFFFNEWVWNLEIAGVGKYVIKKCLGVSRNEILIP